MKRNHPLSPFVDSDLKEQLMERLLELTLPDFERLVLELLQGSGYTNVRRADRIDRRGRTLIGGHDLKAYSHTDLSQSLTIAQIKRHQGTVPRRFVDELRGAMLRLEARHGLLITTSPISSAARRATSSVEWLPITLIDGKKLLELLLGRSMGVKTITVEQQVVDEEFFDKYRKKRIGTGD